MKNNNCPRIVLYGEYSGGNKSESLNVNYSVEIITFASGEVRFFIKNVSVSKTTSITTQYCDVNDMDIRCLEGILKSSYSYSEQPFLNWCIKKVKVKDLPEGSVINYASLEPCELVEHPCLKKTIIQNRYFTQITERENLVLTGDQSGRRHGEYISNPTSWSYETTDRKGWVITILTLEKRTLTEQQSTRGTIRGITKDTNEDKITTTEGYTVFDMSPTNTNFTSIVMGLSSG